MDCEYEYIVIGSGVAAAVLSQCLLQADANASILMLEAGRKIELADRRHWWNFIVERQGAKMDENKRPYGFAEDLNLEIDKKSKKEKVENQSVGGEKWMFRESRLMIRGGSTVHWGGWSLRFKPEDFSLFTATGRGADWPINYDDLESYYGQAERLLAVCGEDQANADPWRRTPYPLPPYDYVESDDRIIKAFEKMGIGYGKMPLARYKKCMTTGTCKYCPIDARFVATHVLDRLEDRYANFELRCEAPVTRLLLESKCQISGVEFVQAGQTKTARAAKVIVCSGAYESPKLLERSGRPFWSDGVGNDYDLLGRYLIAHRLFRARGYHKDNSDEWQREMDFPTLISRHYDNPREQPQGKMFLWKAPQKPDLELDERMIKGESAAYIREQAKKDLKIDLRAFMEEFSNFHNRVTNGRGVNRFGLPQTQVDYTHNPDYGDRLNKRLGQLKAILKEAGLEIDERKTGPFDLRGDHAASTCRMACTPEKGVVDETLKVFGTDNLYVCSNAVFPSGAAVNPTLTLVAMTLRLGDHLTSRPC